LRTIVNEPIRDDEIEPFKNVKRLYRACTNTDLIEAQGLAAVKKVIDLIGGWPVVDGDSWDKGNNWSWQQNMKDSVAHGFQADYLFTITVAADFKNTTKRAVELRGPSYTSTLESPDYTKLKEYLRDLSFRVDLAMLFGADRLRAETDLKEALKFEDELEEVIEFITFLS
jgi:neprilysin